MITQNDLARLNGVHVYDTTGDKIGSVGRVYLDAQGGNLEWVSIHKEQIDFGDAEGSDRR